MDFWSIVEKITNHPAFIAFFGVVLPIVVGALVFLSKTGLGKKAISEFNELLKGANEKVDVTRKSVNEAKETVKNVQEEVKEFKGEIVGQVKTYFAQLEFFESSMFDIISQIPNAKVQEKANQFKSKWQDKKKEIEEFVGGSFVEFDAKLKELEETKNNEIANLSNEIEKLKELFNKLNEHAENSENEQAKEGIND